MGRVGGGLLSIGDQIVYRPPSFIGLQPTPWMVRRMYRVDVYLRVRRAVMVDGMSLREAARTFGLHRDTVRKMLAYSVPPGYRRQTPPRRPKLEPFTGVIDRVLEDDLRRPRKQRHTAKRIFERLRDEYGFDGGYTTVKDYVRENRRQTREMFVPLSHAPGHAQCDFGEALVVIGGVERKAHCFVIDLPHSDGCFVKTYPAETTEAFLDGHVSAFSFLGGVPRSILYDNTKLAVAKIIGDGRRQRTRAFTELQSHYLFEDRFGRPGKGNDKGKVEGLVGYVRRNFLVPVPSFESFDALNAYLERRCLERTDAQLRGHAETIGQRMERDLDALLPLPPVTYDACEKQAGRVSSLSLVRYRTNDYSCLWPTDTRTCWFGATLMRWSSAAGPRSSPDTSVPMSGTISSTTPSTTCRSWSVSRDPWTRPLRYRAGLYPRSSARCAGFWSPAWDGGASGSTCRCSGCWRLSPSRRWL